MFYQQVKPLYPYKKIWCAKPSVQEADDEGRKPLYLT